MKKDFWLRQKRKWIIFMRYTVHKAKRNPESIARGVGLGLFIGFLPSIGFQTILAIILASVLKANKIITVAGTMITNPLTVVPILSASVVMGEKFFLLGNEAQASTAITPVDLSQLDIKSLMANPQGLLKYYLVGGFILSVFFGVLGYFVTKSLAKTAHQNS